MAEANKDIVVRVVGDNSALISSLKDAGVKVNEFGGKTKEAGGLGHAGMQMLSLSAQQAALSLGLPGPVARKLGGQVDDVVAKFGRFSIGIGLATIAITTAIIVYNKLAAYKKSQREELERSVSGMRGEVMALYESAGASDATRKATYDLTIAKRDLMRVESAMLLVAYNDQLKEQTTLLKENGGWWEKAWRNAQAAWRGAMDPERATRLLEESTGEYIAKQTGEVGVLRAKIKVLETEIKRISGAAPDYEKTVYSDIDRYKDETSGLHAAMELRRSQGTLSSEQMMYAELEIFDRGTAMQNDLLLQRGALADEISAKNHQRSLERQALFNNKSRNLSAENWRNAATVTGELSGLMDRFYNASGQKAKAFFYLSRGLAAAESFCNYQVAASEQDAKNNSSMATFYRAMSIAVPAAILAETFAGTGGTNPGGAGGGASTAVTAGLPTTTEKSQEINIFINGVKTDIPDITERIVREIGRNNGSVGGFSVGLSSTG